MSRNGALRGVRAIEFAASEPGIPVDPAFDHPNRGKRSLALYPKLPASAERVHRLLAGVPILIESVRPAPVPDRDDDALLQDLGAAEAPHHRGDRP